MMIRCAVLFVGAALVFCAGTARAAVTEYRGRFDVQAPVEKNLNLSILTEMRSLNNLHTHNESHFDVGLDYKPNKWLSLRPAYRHVTEESKSVWRVEHRPSFDMTFSWSLWALRLSNRNRLEYRMLEASEFFRYRFRLQAGAQPAEAKWLAAYISEEPFYDFSAGEINKNRVTVGFDVKVLGTIRLGFNYVVDNKKSGDTWTAVHAPTLVVKYRQ